MPHIIHREQLQSRETATPGWRRFDLMNDDVAAVLDAGFELSVLASQQATPLHYHTGCEHYMFILHGQGSLTVEGQVSQVSSGYFISVEPGERHAVRNDGAEDFEYLEFIVPRTGATTVVQE